MSRLQARMLYLSIIIYQIQDKNMPPKMIPLIFSFFFPKFCFCFIEALIFH